MFSSFNIFTGKAPVPEIFKTSVEKIVVQTTGNQDPQAQVQKMLDQQLKGMLPVDSFPKIFNLTVWSLLAGLLTIGGGQLASLGIKLIK